MEPRSIRTQGSAGTAGAKHRSTIAVHAGAELDIQTAAVRLEARTLFLHTPKNVTPKSDRSSTLTVRVLDAIFPSRRVERSRPLTSTRLSSFRMLVNANSDTPRSHRDGMPVVRSARREMCRTEQCVRRTACFRTAARMLCS